MNEIINIVSTDFIIFVIGLIFGTLLIIALVFSILLNYKDIRSEDVEKIPIMIIKRDMFEQHYKALVGAQNYLEQNSLSVPGYLEVAIATARLSIKEYEDMNILSIVETLSEDGEKLYSCIMEIIEDEKITLADIKPGMGVYSAISNIVKKIPELKVELSDITGDEMNIIILLIMRSVQSKI